MAKTLREHPEVVEAWSVTGEADAIARVRTVDNGELERLIMDLQQDGQVIRTRSQVVMSQAGRQGGRGRLANISWLQVSPGPGRTSTAAERSVGGSAHPHAVTYRRGSAAQIRIDATRGSTQAVNGVAL